MSKTPILSQSKLRKHPIRSVIFAFVKYFERGIRENLANTALIHLNQISTVELCHRNGWKAFVSHRSGETVGSYIFDMTVALNAGHLKTGAPC